MCIRNSVSQINTVVKSETSGPIGLYVTFENNYSINIQLLHLITF